MANLRGWMMVALLLGCSLAVGCAYHRQCRDCAGGSCPPRGGAPAAPVSPGGSGSTFAPPVSYESVPPAAPAAAPYQPPAGSGASGSGYR